MADAAARSLYGTWEIVEFVSLSGGFEADGIKGTEFRLDDSGDVCWNMAENVEVLPFFTCETFEVFFGNYSVIKFFGSEAGYVIEFKMELTGDTLVLTYENWFMLQCNRMSYKDIKNEPPFSFLNALDGSYFSDLVIVASNGKEFKVHKTILTLSNPHLDWNQNPPPLTGLKDSVLYTILHFMYSECLPASLSEETVKLCLQSALKMPGFGRLPELCEIYLKNVALKQQIMSLVSDMHSCASCIIDYFSGKVPGDSGNCAQNGSENLLSNPAKLCYVMKQSLRECAVASTKLLILCDLFTRRKHELSHEERHEIMKYAKSRLPLFMNQLHKFLEVLKQLFSDMCAKQRQEIATYLVPEIEVALDTMSQFIVDMKSAMEQIINFSNPSDKSLNLDRSKRPIGEMLGKSLKHILHMRELMKLRNVHDKMTISFMNLMQKKGNFSDMSSANKVRSVAKNIEQFTEEIPMFLTRLEELMAALDDKLTWKDWKYMFKFGTSKVAWVLQKSVSHKSTLASVILQACEMINREQFTQSLVHLGLLESAQNSQGSSPIDQGATTRIVSTSPSLSGKPNSMESLNKSPFASDSNLARSAIHLLKSSQNTDMVFEIVCMQDVSDTVIDHTQGHPVVQTTREEEEEVHRIRGHCVIIASRCDWFRRALLSGMRESIDKKIVIHDTSPVLFRLFLEYLYGGRLDSSGLTTEQLADLMLLSDRYEMDPLKQICESNLKNCVNEESVLFLLSIADQFNAKSLRNAALEFISRNPEVVESEVFGELSEDLQAEVVYMIAWVEPRKLPKMESFPGCQYLGPLTPSSVSSSVGDMEEMMANMHMAARENEPSDSSSLEDLPLTQDSTQLEACIVQLREILGDGVPQEELVRVSLAADYDINRALNFFFSAV